jgi:hypothetical protein
MSKEQNERKQRAFSAWSEAQHYADGAKARWGVSSPHRAVEAQERAQMAMEAWMRA